MAVPEFQLKLASKVSGVKEQEDVKVNQRLAKLVKRMDKSFEDKGEFTFPSDVKVWSKVSGGICPEINAKNAISAENECLRVDSIKLDGGSYFVRLNRPLLLGAVLPRSVTGDLPKTKNPKRIKVDNCELRRAGRSSALNQLRVHLVTSLLEKLLVRVGHDLTNDGGDTVFRIGCTDVKLLRECDEIGGVVVEPVQVGVVMGDAATKRRKCEDASVVPTYNRLFERYLRVASERESALSPQQRLRNVHASAAADLSLQLLCLQTSSPCAVATECAQAAAVMYNYVRLVHILRAFEGDVPTVKEIDWALLREPEEWELAFNYVLGYEEIVSELVGGDVGAPRLHRLPQLLFGLSAAFSRYYNRVHVLKEPTPSLLPTMGARIYLLTALKALYERVFDLLDIEPIFNM